MLILTAGTAIVTGVIMVANGAFMLISPHAWLNKLPRWFRFRGKVGVDWRPLTIRLYGAFILAITGWGTYEFFFAYLRLTR